MMDFVLGEWLQEKSYHVSVCTEHGSSHYQNADTFGTGSIQLWLGGNHYHYFFSGEYIPRQDELEDILNDLKQKATQIVAAYEAGNLESSYELHFIGTRRFGVREEGRTEWHEFNAYILSEKKPSNQAAI